MGGNAIKLVRVGSRLLPHHMSRYADERKSLNFQLTWYLRNRTFVGVASWQLRGGKK